MKKIFSMVFLNILVFPLKTISCFKQPFSSSISTVMCEVDSLKDLKASFAIFALKSQRYIKCKKDNFVNCFDENVIHLENRIKLETISLVNGNNSKIIKEWKGPKSEELIELYNEEIESSIALNLKKDGDKIQIKIRVNDKIKEFVFAEFIVLGDYIEFSNSIFSTQKECYLNYFPKEVQLMNHLFYYHDFWTSMFFINEKQYKVKNISDGKNIKSSTIKTPFNSTLSYESKESKKLSGFKFSDFNLSLKHSEEFEAIEIIPPTEISTKPITLFFQTTVKIPKINFDVFFSGMNFQGKHILSRKKSIEITNDEKVTTKVEDNLGFNLVEIQKEESSLKVILCRPSGETTNPIKDRDNLSIEFLDLWANKSTKITINAEEKIEGDFTYTSFTVEKNESKENKSNLYNAITKAGIVSITLNGKKGMIGTYGFTTGRSEAFECIYSDKIISAISEEKPGFFTKKVIIIVVVGIFIFVVIFAYFYFKKKREESLDAF